MFTSTSRYLKLPENGGDVCLVGQIGENLQLKRHEGRKSNMNKTAPNHDAVVY